MKTQITIFDRATGTVFEYRRIVFGAEAIVIRPDQDWIAGFVDGTHYIDLVTRGPVEKPDMPVTVATNTITGIPVGSSLIQNLSRLSGTIDDGEHTFEVDYPQIVHVTLENAYFLPWTGEVPCEPE